MATKKSPEELRVSKFLNRACSEVSGFAELITFKIFSLVARLRAPNS